MKGLAAADWAVLGDDGLARFDIRMVLETTDDALIYLSYTGKADWSAVPEAVLFSPSRSSRPRMIASAGSTKFRS
jgi:hypothetical protein